MFGGAFRLSQGKVYFTLSFLKGIKIESVEKTKRPLRDNWKTESISGKIPQQQNTNGRSFNAA